MNQKISKKTPRQADDKHGFISVTSMLRYECAKLKYQADHAIGINGMTTGFKALDKRTDGLHQGELIVIGADASMGKSALMANMAVRTAMAVEAYSVAMISADLTVEQMLIRIMALEAKVNPERLRPGRLELYDWQQLKAMLGTLRDTSIVMSGAPESMAEMQKELADIQHGKTGLDIVLVDDLQSLAVSMDLKPSTKGIASLMYGLKTIAGELDVAVIITAQLSAAVESRADKRPRLSDLYQSHAIVKEADVIMLLYRDEMYHHRPEFEGLMEIMVVKQNHGDSGTARLLFWPEFSRLEDISSEDVKDVDAIFEAAYEAALQRMNDQQKELDMGNTKTEIRYLTKDFPNLVLPTGKPVCPIEIDVTALSDNEKYRDGGWEDLIRSITAAWVKQHAYAGSGTIWAWGSPSANFQYQSFSMFYTVFGMSTAFRKHLRTKIRKLGKHVRPNSDEVVPSLADGWNAVCHIEDGKAWEPLDPTLWEEIEAE